MKFLRDGLGFFLCVCQDRAQGREDRDCITRPAGLLGGISDLIGEDQRLIEIVSRCVNRLRISTGELLTTGGGARLYEKRMALRWPWARQGPRTSKYFPL